MQFHDGTFGREEREGLGSEKKISGTKEKQCDLEMIKFMFAKMAGFLMHTHPDCQAI